MFSWLERITIAKMSVVQVLNVKLQRADNSVSWGFNLQGGKDFHSPLLIQKVLVCHFLNNLSNLHVNLQANFHHTPCAEHNTCLYSLK